MERNNVHDKSTRTWGWRWNGQYKAILLNPLLYLNMQGSLTNNIEFLQPYGFDVGQSERGNVLKGLDLGVEGMRVGGQVSS